MVPPLFFENVLTKLGAPVSHNNLAILNLWAKHEGGRAAFNPLNTTKNATGATAYNTAGVKNYPDFETGVNATAATLKLSYYAPIVSALKNDKSFSYWQGNGDIIHSINTWGTTNFAATLQRTAQIVQDQKKKIIPALLLISGGILIIYNR